MTAKQIVISSYKINQNKKKYPSILASSCNSSELNFIWLRDESGAGSVELFTEEVWDEFWLVNGPSGGINSSVTILKYNPTLELVKS